MPAADTSFAEFGAELASLLGLPAGASLKELMAKLAARLMKAPEEPDPSKYMPVAAVQEMLSVRRAENDAVAEGRAQEKAKSVVKWAAVQSGYITRGMQTWALALCPPDCAGRTKRALTTSCLVSVRSLLTLASPRL